jgi:hypothetical protein
MEFYITGLKAREPMSTRKRRAFRGIRPFLATPGTWRQQGIADERADRRILSV